MQKYVRNIRDGDEIIYSNFYTQENKFTDNVPYLYVLALSNS